MSTKIYNGFRLAPGTDVFAFAASLRQVLNPVRDRLDAIELATRATLLIDTADLAGLPRPPRPVSQAFREFDDEQRTMNPHLRRHDPHRFEVSIAPDPRSGRLHLLAFADRPELFDALLSIEVVEEYGYWDNADPREGLTPEHWIARRDAWRRVLPGWATPSEAMLGFRLRSPSSIGMRRLAGLGEARAISPLVIDQVPSVERRAADMVRTSRMAALTGGPETLLEGLWRANAGLGGIVDQVADLLPCITADDLEGRGSGPDLRVVRELLSADASAWVTCPEADR